MIAAEPNTTGQYQPYPEYKDSGGGWLRQVPSHWEFHRSKSLFELVTSGSRGWADYYSDEGALFFRIANLTRDTINPKLSSVQNVTPPTSAEGERSQIKSGDILISITADLGSVCVADDSIDGGYVSQHVALCRPSINVECSRWLGYVVASDGTKEQLLGAGYGGTKIQLSLEDIKTFWLPVPPIHERYTIAAFLDYETARIDRLVAQQQRLIELLKEKRQAVISHAVTKGINPDAPMKDSGVEWLGQVPKHWIIRRLKHIATIQSGIPKGKDLADKETITVPMLRVANVQDGYLSLDNVHELKIEPHELIRYSLKAGDVLMNEGGDNNKLGRGAVWSGQITPCIHQNHVFAIRVNNIEPEWLSWLTSSSYAKFYFYAVAKQSTNLASISSSNVKETPLVLPPKMERAEIMRYLDGKVAKFARLESQATLQIELLQERRTALISAAVTGKIDLRGWTPPTAEEAA